jgi:hypothetical protein
MAFHKIDPWSGHHDEDVEADVERLDGVPAQELGVEVRFVRMRHFRADVLRFEKKLSTFFSGLVFLCFVFDNFFSNFEKNFQRIFSVFCERVTINFGF